MAAAHLCRVSAALLSPSRAATSRLSRRTGRRPLSATAEPSEETDAMENLDRYIRQERRIDTASLMNSWKKRQSPVRMKNIPRERLPEMRVLRSLYLQWGFVRHHEKSGKKDYKAWKIQLNRVLRDQGHYSTTWIQQGRFLFELDHVDAMREAWEAEELETRQRIWPDVMLSTLCIRPGKLIQVLDATLDLPAPGYAIHDLLLIIARTFKIVTRATVAQKTAQADEMLGLIIRVFEDLPAGHVPFCQRTFGMLARELPCQQTSELYKLLVKKGCKMHEYTLLQFARKFASEVAHKPKSLDIMLELAERGTDLNKMPMTGVVTLLLHCKEPHRDGPTNRPASPFSPQEALGCLVEAGLAPNVIHVTALLDSLGQQGEVDESIRLALLFSDCGIQLDKKAWVTVVRSAKHSLDVDKFVQSLEVANKAMAPQRDLLNYGLHSVMYFANLESRETARPPPWTVPLFEPMLELYASRFSLVPLQRWFPEPLPLVLAGPPPGRASTSGHVREWRFRKGILPVVEGLFYKGITASSPQLQPDTTTVATMMRAFIRTVKSPMRLMSYFFFFRAQLERRTSAARCLLHDKGSLVHDAFIMAMTERDGLLSPALELFGEMIRENLPTVSGSSEEEQDEEQEDGEWQPEEEEKKKKKKKKKKTEKEKRVPMHPSPSTMTLALILRGLLGRGDRKTAEEIIQVLKELGVDLNLVGWNTLLKGYASMQFMHDTVATLQNLEAAGYRPDVFTFDAFARLHRQQEAIAHMQAIIDRHRSQQQGFGGGWV
ncbi:hypothetical protein L249_1444 [Ophiocordyceps polyrhachis-furcata BCC 54312]|uniref:Pentacotripeptide-repeat region of PRORP domain-containing protein n=1 Tax=Ophiocordyceps polyrhachis-furcata BCC 54312 TaxID=1330021 RepID=A0A367L455_9HYPO|nr:hypothetical protein L249_1444 [Ophiocordyceps polyrhachis-furcata BCC 54312]